MEGDKGMGDLSGKEADTIKRRERDSQEEGQPEALESQVLQSFTQDHPYLLDHVQILTFPFEALNRVCLTYSTLLIDDVKISISYPGISCQSTISK